MRLRRATISDVPALVALNRSVQGMHADAFPGRFRRDAPDGIVALAFQEKMEAPSSYWVLAETEAPIGFLSAEFREVGESWCLVAHRVCYLAGIVVAPGFRRMGIARALLAELKREAANRGVSRVELDVWAFNEPAAQFFAKAGFQPLMQRLTLSLSGPDEPREAR